MNWLRGQNYLKRHCSWDQEDMVHTDLRAKYHDGDCTSAPNATGRGEDS